MEEQKYLTRSEALKAMEEGERVREVINIQPGEFWMKKDILLTTARVDVSAWKTFGRYTKFVLVPQPDSPEKCIRESFPILQEIAGDKEGLAEAAGMLGVLYRMKNLIQQMDKEGKV